jgi:hypothetical protein
MTKQTKSIYANGQLVATISDKINNILKSVEWEWRGWTSGNPEAHDPGRGNFLSPRSAGTLTAHFPCI